MRVAGIICEYNPFHNGHKYLLDEAKKSGCAVVAVMSGNYTQRGEIAIADKYTRAEAAVKCGADLVLELPFPFCMSSAEFFAKGGVSVLGRIGAEKIFFGSESGDISLLEKAAERALSGEFADLRDEISKAEGSAKGYFDALGALMGEDTALLSNDILGIEYLKAIRRQKLEISPVAVKRLGDGFRDKEINSDFASATAIRNALFDGSLCCLENYMPNQSFEILKRRLEAGELPADIKKLETAILSFWRLADPSLLGDIAELGNGLEYRIRDAALASASLAELEEKVATKKYTAAKIRRAILFAMLGVTKSDLDAALSYTSVLAANKIGRELLSSLRRDEGELKIVTKTADAPVCRQQQLSSAADALYTLAIPGGREASYISKKKIYME